MAILTNAPSPITTPTYDGSGQTVHPSVLDFGQGIIRPGHTAWNGYRYWMAMTPYPNSQAIYENPSLLCSHDGLTWTEPPGFQGIKGTHDDPSTGPGNPMLDVSYWAPADHSNHYCNDPHMLYIAEHDELWVWFGRMYKDPDTGAALPGYGVYVVTYGTDNITRGPYFTNTSGLHVVERKAPGELFHAWQVRLVTRDGTSGYVLGHRTSTDGLVWGSTFDLPTEDSWDPWRLLSPALGPAHFGGTLRANGNTVDFIVATAPYGSVAPSIPLVLPYFHARTYLDDPTRWDYPLGITPILESGGDGAWDRLLYRQSFVIQGSDCRMWYSAMSSAGEWRTGYTEGFLTGLIPDTPFADQLFHRTEGQWRECSLRLRAAGEWR